MEKALRYLLGTPGPSGFGSATTAEKVTEGISLDGRRVIITGATAGIGIETARVLALRGANVILAARNLKKAEEVKDRILKEIPSAKLEVRELDVSSFQSVRKFAEGFKAENLPLNLLINNAGFLAPTFKLGEDGHESMFTTNHLGHFLLTELLLENLVATAKEAGVEGRIVILSSSLHSKVKGGKILFDQINDPKGYDSVSRYALSKLANILHASELSRRLKERGVNVTANSLHPGVVGTNLTADAFGPIAFGVFKNAGRPFLKSVAQGAATTLFVATSPSLNGVSGKFFDNCNEDEPQCELGKNAKVAAELWGFSQRVTAA